MASAKKAGENLDALKRVCPECGADRITATMKTSPGYYCLCRSCGHIWHQDNRPDGTTH